MLKKKKHRNSLQSVKKINGKFFVINDNGFFQIAKITATLINHNEPAYNFI